MDFKMDIQTRTLVDKIEMSILDYIKASKLVPGDAFPNEKILSTELGISRNVLREALSRLRMLGIVQSRTKRGIVVREPSLLSGFEKVIEQLYLLGERAIADLMGMRIVLEVGITDFLFRNVTERTVAELEKIVRSQRSRKNRLTVEQETVFHNKIYEISGNKFIIQFQQIVQPVFRFAEENYENYFEPVSRRLEREGKIVTHGDLFKFIKNRDVEGYRNAIRLHLQIYMEFICREG